MYSHKFVIVLCVVGAVTAYHSYNNNDDLKVIDSIHDEPQCTSQGGLCVKAVDCPSGSLTEQRGLCPEQRSIGVECCYGQSVKETRCEKRLGRCTPDFCNGNLIQELATDCPKDTVCCTFV